MKGTPSTEGDESLGSSHAVAASASSLTRLAQASKSIPKRAPSLADQRGVTLDQLNTRFDSSYDQAMDRYPPSFSCGRNGCQRNQAYYQTFGIVLLRFVRQQGDRFP